MCFSVLSLATLLDCKSCLDIALDAFQLFTGDASLFGTVVGIAFAKLGALFDNNRYFKSNHAY